eukprot:TRINITY_DN12385_c0_g3_i1.p2 TRINITY_DN12385_c0_g3~~TRINITY_DN12385_c0_g3_i1.p2  ORF type:complete len:386 (+),score=67.47 TRINITY_DN12385_c0_g3_i1:1857-3014(+)
MSAAPSSVQVICGHPSCGKVWHLVKRDIPLSVKTKASKYYCAFHPNAHARLSCNVSKDDYVRAMPPCERNLFCSRPHHHSGKCSTRHNMSVDEHIAGVEKLKSDYRSGESIARLKKQLDTYEAKQASLYKSPGTNRHYEPVYSRRNQTQKSASSGSSKKTISPKSPPKASRKFKKEATANPPTTPRLMPSSNYASGWLSKTPDLPTVLNAFDTPSPLRNGLYGALGADKTFASPTTQLMQSMGLASQQSPYLESLLKSPDFPDSDLNPLYAMPEATSDGQPSPKRPRAPRKNPSVSKRVKSSPLMPYALMNSSPLLNLTAMMSGSSSSSSSSASSASARAKSKSSARPLVDMMVERSDQGTTLRPFTSTDIAAARSDRSYSSTRE